MPNPEEVSFYLHIRRNRRYDRRNPRRFLPHLRCISTPLLPEERRIRVTLNIPESLFSDHTLQITHEVTT